MKLGFLVILLLIQQSSCHLKRVGCKTSGLTVIDILCQLKLLNRTNQLLSVGAKLATNITDAKGYMTWEYKSYRNWRQIYKSPEIDLCMALTMGSKLPFLRAAIDFVRSMFPTSCPIFGPRAEYYYNVLIYNYEAGMMDYSNVGPIQLPNGQYRYKIFANSKTDPEGGHVEWINEVNRIRNFAQW